MKKICKSCNGRKNVHTEGCFTKKALDAVCDCGFPTCQDCVGTGVRGRKK